MRSALTLLTVFGRSTEPTPRTWAWFPVIGAGIGALVGGVWWLADEAFSPVLAATLVVAADLAITGMLHVDGLADSADGLLCHAPPDERLRIMRKPDVGAFGVAVVAIALLVAVAALASQPVSVALLVAVWCGARTLVAITPVWVPYARDQGMAAVMLTTPVPAWPVLALVPSATVAVWADGARGGAALAAAVTAAGAVVLLARRRIGGFTGDVLGAAIVVGQTVGLVVAAARW